MPRSGVCLIMLLVAGAMGCDSRSSGHDPHPSEAPIGGNSSSSGSQPVNEGAPLATADPLQIEEAARAKPDNPRVVKFAELDKDQDGRLSATEFGAGRSAKDASKWFRRRDADEDGFLNLAEFAPQSAAAAGGAPSVTNETVTGEQATTTLNQ
jgi:hypothetical protein